MSTIEIGYNEGIPTVNYSINILIVSVGETEEK